VAKEEEELMKALVVAVASATAVLMLTPHAGFGDDVEDLGELLVKKGVITQQEWERLREEQQQKKAQGAAAAQSSTAPVQGLQQETNDLRQQVQALRESGGQVKVGGVNVTLGGFIEMATIYRTRNEVADVGSDYNQGIPFKNSALYHENETRFSARQSRFSLLAAGDVTRATHLAAYYELDFLGNSTSSNSRESNSYAPRTRQVYGTLDEDDWCFHLLFGQAWSLLTTNTQGIIPRQEQIPLTIDAQYVEGFNWTRNPQIRLVEDFGHGVWLGVSAQSPQAVTSPIIAPSNVNATNPGNAAGLLNNATTYSTDELPDFVGKIALDPGWGHYEAKGLAREFTVRSGGSNEHALGYGVGGAAAAPIVPGMLEVQLSGLYGPGIGRYGSGQLPDFAYDADNTPHAITEGQALGGLIAYPWAGNSLYVYYGYEHADRTGANSVSGYGAPILDNSGCFVEGGSCTVAAAVPATTTTPAKPPTGAETQELKQITGGFWQDIYKGHYGRFTLGMQGGEIWRDAFRGVGGAPSTNIGIFMTSLRYYPF
jgi:hypothetical protein